ncbi:MAG: imelysin family protein [Ketobacter sp.]
MKHVFSAALIFAFLILSACGGSKSNTPLVVNQDTISNALRLAVDNSILVAVTGFEAQASGLSTKAATFCEAPATATLSAAQQQWALLVEQWYRLEAYKFGPLDDDIVFPAYNYIDSYRLRGTDYTATVRTEIKAMMNSSESLTEAYFDNKNFNQVGLLALEVTLFETADTQSQQPTDILNDFTSAPRKCEILKGLSLQLLKRARYVEEGWNQQHKNSDEPYRELFLSNRLDDGAEPLTQLLASIQEHLDYLQQRNVVTNTSRISGHAWRAVTASIDEIESLLKGDDDAETSFFKLMRKSGFATSVDTVESNIQMARDSITLQDPVQFEIAVAQLDGNFKREIPNGLEVELGINFTDGD